MTTTLLPCTTIGSDVLALALEISRDEGITIREALTLARAQIRDMLAYAHAWDAAVPQAVNAA